jgi:hypothetical protein
MSKRNVVLTPKQVLTRLSQGAEFSHAYTYKNPYLLATLYYTEGMSTTEVAQFLNCNERTVRRYMNYYGFKRYTKKFSQLVRYYGIEKALEIMEPEYYPLGVHND